MKRFFFAIPIPYNNPDSFWHRESSLIIRGLREMGHEAFLVALHPTRDQPPDTTWPVINCTLAEMADAAWWKSQRPDAIALNLWSAPRYDAIRKAALGATPRVIERLDASGVRVPRIWPHYYFVQTWGGYASSATGFAFLRAVLKTAYTYFFASVLEKPMALTMAQLPWVVAESPLAAARVDRHIRMYSKKGARVAQISNPVNTAVMCHDPVVAKENALVAVARWDSFQKDFPLLIRSAINFLTKYPDWTFELVGKGVDVHRSLIDGAPPEVSQRIHIHGVLPYSEVAAINQRAKIHFIASHWEGFCNASVEALCCGCSYVGPINIAASSYLIENRSGTIAPRRRQADLFDALCAEAEAWKMGRRDPAFIAEKWAEQSGYLEVARRTLELFESIS